MSLEKMWYNIVFEYSRRLLTESGDKLPAFSGIANWFLRGSQDSYLAGLLRHDLHHGLSWHIDPRFIQDSQQQQGSNYRAPSWSWASTDQRVFFAHNSNEAKRPIDPQDPPWDLISLQTRVRVHHAQVETHGQNPFGQSCRRVNTAGREGMDRRCPHNSSPRGAQRSSPRPGDIHPTSSNWKTRSDILPRRP